MKEISFVVLQEHINKFKIDEKIKEFFPDAKIVAIPEILNGAVLTCMDGINEINDDLPIIFNDCDHDYVLSQLYRKPYNQVSLWLP